MKRLLYLLLSLLTVVSLLGTLGCGSGGSNPATPLLPTDSNPLLASEASEHDGAGVLGVYDVTFDPATEVIEYARSRDAETHFNITNQIMPSVNIGLVSYNPGAGQLIFDVFIGNPSGVTMYL